jgi:hypothetical protein
MKVAYFLKDTPVELSAIPALLTQDTMKATGSAVVDRLRARLSEEELRDVTVQVRLKKRFFGADEVSTKIDGPADILRKIEAGGELFSS